MDRKIRLAGMNDEFDAARTHKKENTNGKFFYINADLQYKAA